MAKSFLANLTQTLRTINAIALKNFWTKCLIWPEIIYDAQPGGSLDAENVCVADATRSLAAQVTLFVVPMSFIGWVYIGRELRVDTLTLNLTGFRRYVARGLCTYLKLHDALNKTLFVKFGGIYNDRKTN